MYVACEPGSDQVFYTYVAMWLLFFVAALVALTLYLGANTNHQADVIMAQRAANPNQTALATTVSSLCRPRLSRSTRFSLTLLPFFLRVLNPLRRILARWNEGQTRRLFTRDSLHRPKTEAFHLFHIPIRPIPQPISVHPEKVKILISFVQVFATLKDTYGIPWPRTVAAYMALFMPIRGSFLALPYIDCVWGSNYYRDLRSQNQTISIYRYLHKSISIDGVCVHVYQYA